MSRRRFRMNDGTASTTGRRRSTCSTTTGSSPSSAFPPSPAPPNLTESHTMEGKKVATFQTGNTTITPLNKKDETINLNEGKNSERDDAEGNDNELCSNLESEDVDRGQPLKVPCILIFDSLGIRRNDVVVTLRDYLEREFKNKFPNDPPQPFQEDVMYADHLMVPQQKNGYDCGLFLLQYVEQFFKDPIKDFQFPIKSMLAWFHQDVVTKKREEIALLLQQLNISGINLPEIEFPTKNGKILNQPNSIQEAEESAFDDGKVSEAKEKKRKNESSSSESSAKTPKNA